MKRTRGRPKKTEEEKRAQVVLTLDPEILNKTKSIIRRGRLSRTIDLALKKYLKL